MRSTARVVAIGAVLGALIGCSSSAGESRVLTLETLNDSGVNGSVTLTPLGNGHTEVTVQVDPAGHPNMPAHIHPGTCEELVPQPKYPLQSVVAGRSTTDVPASLDDLLSDTVALNLHASNSQMELYTACIELGTASESASSTPAPSTGRDY